jgi:hypothetical protein
MANEGPGSLERFRLRRALETTGKICDDLERGTMAAGHPEVEQLQASSRRFLAVVEAAKSKG